MKQNSAKPAEKTKSNKGDVLALVAGITAVLLMAALVVIGVKFFAKPSLMKQSGQINGATETRVGSSVKYIYRGGDAKTGDEIKWYADGELIRQETYDGGEISCEYAPQKAGSCNLCVEIGGKYFCNREISVGKRLVKVSAKNYSVTYGDDLPDFEYETTGLPDGETFSARVIADNSPYRAGIYTLAIADASECPDCDVEFTDGILEILPRQLTISDSFSKQYDGTNVLEGYRQIGIDGVCSGDDVSAECDAVYFDSKDAGDRRILPYNFRLVGDDAGNYVLQTEELYGQITPKPVTVEGFSVYSKRYDGTNKAAVRSLGTLSGTVEGDVVAIGGYEVSFDSAQPGKGRRAALSQVTFVGRDKQNYVLETTPEAAADIDGDYLGMLFNRPDVIRIAN